VPGQHDHFLINPYGLLFDEVSASSLVKIDAEGNKVEPSESEVNSQRLDGGQKGHQLSALRANYLRIRTGNFLRPYRELNRANREILARIRESRPRPRFGDSPW
jgi:hypothetical protein